MNCVSPALGADAQLSPLVSELSGFKGTCQSQDARALPVVRTWSVEGARGGQQSRWGELEAQHAAAAMLYCQLTYVHLLPSTWLWHLVSYRLCLSASLYAELSKTMLRGGSVCAEPAPSNPGTHKAS